LVPDSLVHISAYLLDTPHEISPATPEVPSNEADTLIAPPDRAIMSPVLTTVYCMQIYYAIFRIILFARAPADAPWPPFDHRPAPYTGPRSSAIDLHGRDPDCGRLAPSRGPHPARMAPARDEHDTATDAELPGYGSPIADVHARGRCPIRNSASHVTTAEPFDWPSTVT